MYNITIFPVDKISPLLLKSASIKKRAEISQPNYDDKNETLFTPSNSRGIESVHIRVRSSQILSGSHHNAKFIANIITIN